MTMNEHAESSSAKASSSNGLESHKTEAKRRRRLDDLSFASPGPAFMGTPTDSKAGDEDSDVGTSRKRLSRHSSSFRQSQSISAISSQSKGSSPGPSAPRHVASTPEVPKPSPLFRNFKSDKVPSPSINVRKKMTNGVDYKKTRHSLNGINASRDPDTDPSRTTKSVAEVKAAPRIERKPVNGRKSSPLLQNSPVRYKRILSQSSQYEHIESPRQQPPFPQGKSEASAISGNNSNKEKLLSIRKKQLDIVYKEHDLLIRELFHLTKFVTYFGYDPEVASQDRSDVFERFRMDYDLPTLLSGATGRATRRVVSAKRGDLELEAAKKREAARLTKVENNGNGIERNERSSKAREGAEEKTKRHMKSNRKSIAKSTSASDSDSSDDESVRRKGTAQTSRRGVKRGLDVRLSSSSEEDPESVGSPAKKRGRGRPKQKRESPSPEYVPRPPVIIERIDGVPRMRALQPAHLPPPSRFRHSLGDYLQSWHTTGEYLGGGMGEMEMISEEALFTRERRDAWLYNAIDAAKAEGLLQSREEAVQKNMQNRVLEAPRSSTHWDGVLHEMTLESNRKKIEMRNKVAICKRVSRMIVLFWDKKLGRGERQKKVEERRIRGLAKYTIREVRKQWKLAVNVIKARRTILEKEEKEKMGRAQLQNILEQSSQMLGQQHRTLIQGEQEEGEISTTASDESVTDSETSESEHDSFSDEEATSEMADQDGSIDENQGGEKENTVDEKRTPNLISDEVAEVAGSDVEMSRGESVDSSTEAASTIPAQTILPQNDDASAIDTPKVRPPFLLRGKLRPYQQVGFEWLANLYNNGSNGILADEMGLGKTIQTISVLAHLACDKGEWGPHLVVAPTSVMLNWEVEFKKFLPGFKILSYYGSQKERKEKRRGWNSENHFNVCITSYQLVLADQHILRRKAWQYLILDEAHHIKNFKSQRWQTLLGFNSKRRLLLTGTPLQNNLMDLWSLMYFLMPNGVTSADGIVNSGFASMKEFQQWFSNPLGKAVENAGMGDDQGAAVDEETRGMVSKLHTLLRPYLLRRMKSEVEKELPNKYEHVIKCRLSKRQKFLYNDFMSRAKTRESLASGNYLSIINCLMQLRKVCNHPDLFEQRPIVTSFVQSRSVVADYEIKDLLVRRELLQSKEEEKVNFRAINLHLNSKDNRYLTPIMTSSLQRLDATDSLPKGGPLEDVESIPVDTWSIEGYKRTMAQRNEALKAAQWKQARYLNRFRCQDKPIANLDNDTIALWSKVVPKRHLLPLSFASQTPRDYLDRSDCVHQAILSYDDRRSTMQDVIDRYAFVTPRAVCSDITRWALPNLDYATAPKEMLTSEFDTLHQPAVKLQIAFPDASLLQYDCGKLQELAILMQKCKQGGHRILIFTQMTKILDILEIWLSYNGFKYMRLDGSTKIEDRQALTERFNRDDRIKAFILSTRSGGLGINLTGADMVLFWDLDWNFQIEAQCMDRAHRIGQTRDVHIYRFVSEHTIEENMLKKSNEKRMLDNMVIRNGQFTTEGLGKMSWIESMFDEGGQSIAGVQVGNTKLIETIPDDNRIENAMDQVEDEEDANAAKNARRELHLLDDDFEQEMNQEKIQDSENVDPIEVVNGEMISAQDDIDGKGEEEIKEEEGGTVDDYMLKRVDAEWDYFVNL